MNKVPKVSVIVPVYNVEQYLERCLKSISKQLLKDIEIVIVNDGSTDNSLKICEKFAQKDGRIKIITCKNGGLAAARNTGLEYVTGEYVGFIDSDDWIDLDFYKCLYNTAKKYDSDIAYADFIRKGKNKCDVRMDIKYEEVSTDINDKIKKCKNLTLGCVWNKIYRRDLIKKNSLRFPEGRLYEDGIFSMQAIYYANSVVSVPNTYYYYFVNPTSIVKSKKTQKKIDDRFITQHDILNFIREKHINLSPEEFLTVVYKIRLWFLTLLVKKEDWFVKKYFLFGSIPILTIKKNTNDRIIGNCLGIKFSVREKQYSYKKIIELNKPYEEGDLKIPIVKNSEETLEELINSNKSICRFGDGELNIVLGESIPFQTFSEEIQKHLKTVLTSNNENIMVGIPNVFGSLEHLNKNQKFWRKYVFYNRENFYSLLSFETTYYDAIVSRVYTNNSKNKTKIIFEKFKKIWNQKDVIFVEGEGTRLGFGNDLFNNAKSIQRIVCPAINAFNKYDEILKTCLEFDNDKLFIIALGPTATVLAYDLAQNDYRALDLGHIDIEYEWFMHGARKAIPIKSKYVFESKKGKIITTVNDKKYNSQIYKNLC